MADTLYMLTQDDVTKLKNLLRTVEERGLNVGRATRPEDDPTAPDTYVALIPSGGIPARSGTTPGSATCDTYKVINRDTAPELVATGFTKLVINLSTATIEEGEYVEINKDKYGTWLVGPASGSDESTVLDPTPCVAKTFSGAYLVNVNFFQRFELENGDVECRQWPSCEPDCDVGTADGETGTGDPEEPPPPTLTVPNTINVSMLIIGGGTASRTFTISSTGYSVSSATNGAGTHIPIPVPDGTYTVEMTQLAGGETADSWDVTGSASDTGPGNTTDPFVVSDSGTYNVQFTIITPP